MQAVDIDTGQGRIQGFCDTRFNGVLDAFQQNFLTRDEVGASLALTLEGATVIDLWGGTKTRGGEPWTADMVCTVFSATKGMMALCAHLLADRGQLPSIFRRRSRHDTPTVSESGSGTETYAILASRESAGHSPRG